MFKRFGGAIYPRETRALVQRLVHTLEWEARVLDLGGGTGILSEIASEARPDLKCFVLDPAMGMLKNAPRFAGKVSGKAENLPFADHTFGVVLIGDALHHFSDPQEALVQVRRVLGQKGRLFIFDIDPDTFMGRVITFAEKLFGEPALFFSPKRLSGLLKDEGFRPKINRHDWRYSVTAEAEEERRT